MKTFRSTRIASLIFSFCCLMMFNSFSPPSTGHKEVDASSGELSFTVRTVSAGGNYAPRHVLAIWIQSADAFVKTRKAMAGQRIQYLYTWAAISNYNVVDAITGPTLLSHQTHTISWDCTDLSGNIVPDGEYTVYVEFTSQHAQGPLFSLNFTKGPDPQFITPPDETYFKDMVLTFTPVIAEFSASDTAICTGDTITFTDGSVNATSWEWNFGEGASPASATTQGPHAVMYTSTGAKSISLTVNGSLTEMKEAYVHVDDPPIADFTFSGSDLTVAFTNTSANALNFLWDFGDGNTSTENNPLHTYAAAGAYGVSLTAGQMSCEDTYVQEVMVPMVGLDETVNDRSIQVFPNPNHGRFFISIKLRQKINSIRLINSSGQLVRNVDPGSVNNTIISIDLENEKKGIYFLEIAAEKEVFIRKILHY